MLEHTIFNYYFLSSQTPYGSEWFTRAVPSESIYPQHHHPMAENHGLQRQNFGQRLNNQRIPSNFNQQSSSYDMRPPAMFYRPPIEMPVQSSPYTFVKQYPAKDRMLVGSGNVDKSYARPNYGFQPSDHDTHQPITNSYTQMVPNSPIYPNYGYRRPGNITNPMVPYASTERRGSRYAPTTTPNQGDDKNENFSLLHLDDDSSFQERYGKQRDSTLRFAQVQTSSASQQAPQQNIPCTTDLPQIQIQIHPPSDTINADAIPKDGTTSVQTVPDKVTANSDDTIKADSSKTISKSEVVQNVTLGSNKANWYDQYRVLPLPISPKLMSKVALFEQKRVNTMSTTSVSNIPEHSPSCIPHAKPTGSLDKASDMATSSNELTTTDIAIKVCYYNNINN